MKKAEEVVEISVSDGDSSREDCRRKDKMMEKESSSSSFNLGSSDSSEEDLDGFWAGVLKKGSGGRSHEGGVGEKWGRSS
ncbi:hypothetical protein L484_024944 [Morus notabilis]|uniref:Uncharacterized protein n=1 Tax=Morus notabilis TaxID=981085 RepID=W9R3A9_9ROSA|nr:hypothetical protein L484_024944 [Morus notabilis]